MNKRIRKKTMKRLERLELVKVVAPTPPVKPVTVTAKELFEAKLNEAYSGAVVSLTSYVNPRAVLVFHCKDCGISFFGRPSHMVGRKSQRHECGMPLGDSKGERFASVSSPSIHKKKNNSKEIEKQIEEMIWCDYSWKAIASELKVNPAIIHDHFKAMGLIE